jgi:hypothetical protein
MEQRYITPLNEIELECQAIQDYLEEKVPEDINALAERGNMLSVYLARTGKLMSDSSLHYNLSKSSEVGKLIEKIIKEAMLSARVQNALVDSISAREQSLVVWTERLHKTIVRQLEWCRTLISKAKEEMKFSR